MFVGLVARNIRKKLLKYTTICYISKFCYHCYLQILRGKKVTSTQRQEHQECDTLRSHTWFPHARLDACRGISIVVGTKARGYTVTRKIAPATGPKSHSDKHKNQQKKNSCCCFSLLKVLASLFCLCYFEVVVVLVAVIVVCRYFVGILLVVCGWNSGCSCGCGLCFLLIHAGGRIVKCIANFEPVQV